MQSAIASGEPIDLEALSKAANRPVSTQKASAPCIERGAADRAAVFEQVIASAKTSEDEINKLKSEIRDLDSESAASLGTVASPSYQRFQCQ